MKLPSCLEECLCCYTAGNPLDLRNGITFKEEIYKICHLKTLPCLMHLLPVIFFPLLYCLQSSWCRAVELAIEDERLVVYQSLLCLFAPNWSCQCDAFYFLYHYRSEVPSLKISSIQRKISFALSPKRPEGSLLFCLGWRLHRQCQCLRRVVENL